MNEHDGDEDSDVKRDAMIREFKKQNPGRAGLVLAGKPIDEKAWRAICEPFEKQE